MIDVLLLAGGESTRFWPFTDKNLTPFFGKPLLLWHFEQLVRLGVKNVVVVANELSLTLIKRVEVPKKLVVSYVVQDKKGQGQAVLAAGPSFGEKPALILNASDIYDDELLKQLLDASKREPEVLHLASVKVTSYFPGGYVKFKPDQTIGEIVEKPKPGKEPSDFVDIGVEVIPNMQKLCALLVAHGKHPISGFEKTLTKLMHEGMVGKALMTDSQWLYLKYPWHILSVMDACLATIDGQMIDPSAKIGKFVTIEGPVIIEKDVKVSEGTKIVGPAFIGKGTIIGNNNLIRHSHIGSECVTGFSSDITRSYIGSNCWFHTNYVGDSVIASNVAMGSGAVLANVRLDESSIPTTVKEEVINTKRTKLGAMIGSGVRIGVNVSVMPGIKIGSNSFIGAGVTLGQDIKDGMYCRATPTVVISENTKKAPASREEFRKKL